MVNVKASGTREVPLKLANRISEQTRTAWDDGSLLENVTPVTRELLRFWDPAGSFAEERDINFHKGQWQAILNTIYVQEGLKMRNGKDM